MSINAIWKTRVKSTDGESALIEVCLKPFSKYSLLTCTNHFEANCKDFFLGISIKENMEDAMLDVVFGEHILVEADLKGKNERCYYLAIRNGKIVFTTGRAYTESREKTDLRKDI